MKLFIFTKKQLQHCFIFLMIILCFSMIFYLSFDTAVLYASGDKDIDENANLSDFEKTIHGLCKNEEKIAYLTFDDGPIRKVTPKVLDILKENQVPATFFVVGKHVVENPDLVQREFEEGHFIANHGYSHNNKKLYQSNDSFLQEITKTEEAIAHALNVPSYRSYLFRFPNGSMSRQYLSQKKNCKKLLSSIDYTYIDWNCLNNDSIKKYSKSQLLQNLKKSAKNKGTLVILMHDTGDVNRTYDVLQDSIDYLKSEGYEFHNFYDFVSKDDII